MITAAADGSALGNPGPAGWAWYIDENTWASGGWECATNNQGELEAVRQLLLATRDSGEDMLILCDSQYVINCLTKWIWGWKKKGWRKADGKPVLNADLIREIDALLAQRKASGCHISFEWVRGHTGHPLNEAADARANAAAQSMKKGTPPAAGPTPQPAPAADSQSILTAAADGSALGNPGPAGWAWYIDENTWAAGGWERATNNQGELEAVRQLLLAYPSSSLRILCDSQYVINCLTTWLPGWKKKGWRKADGKPILNGAVITELDSLLTTRAAAGLTTTFEWVKGHAGHPLNEAADTRANAAATAFSAGRSPQHGPGPRQPEHTPGGVAGGQGTLF